jgi:hypothetical protein
VNVEIKTNSHALFWVTKRERKNNMQANNKKYKNKVGQWHTQQCDIHYSELCVAEKKALERSCDRLKKGSSKKSETEIE